MGGRSLTTEYAQRVYDEIRDRQAVSIYVGNDADRASAEKWFEKQRLSTPTEDLLSENEWTRRRAEEWFKEKKIKKPS